MIVCVLALGMRIRSKLAWKLTVVVATILTAAIAVSGYINNLICAHYSLGSARTFLRFNSESIVDGIGELMMSRNNKGIKKLITEMSHESEVYGEIQLISHHSGEVVVSRFDHIGDRMLMDDWNCAVCHDQDDLGGVEPETVDAVTVLPDGGRSLSVMTPIINEPRCRTAACHIHESSPPILGFLNAHYSLEPVDAMVSDRRILILITVLASVLAGAVVLWFMFARLLERPIRGLIAGTERIAAREFGFRFDRKRQDEIGVLEESFNAMTATIQTHQEEVRSAKERLEGVIESSADIIITVDPDGLVETFNRGAEQALGYKRDEVIGKRIETIFADPRDREDAIRQLTDTDAVRNFETRFVAKDGQVRDVLLTISRLHDKDGAFIGTFGISKDVTQEKKLQRELIQSQKFAAIGQAVTAIQHAVKNMLNTLKGGAYIARDGVAKNDQKHAEEGWTMVDAGIERISSLSENMLNYAKEWKRELRRVDLCDLTAKVLAEHRQPAAEHGVTLRLETPDGLPEVLCDPKLIHMAVTDLVVNAIDACVTDARSADKRSEVLLKNELNGKRDSFIIEVRDNGCGMDEETRQNIFTPFFTTKSVRGTGLGLALTVRAVNVHGGEIFVESELQRGTAFRIYLPIDGPTA